MSITITVKKLVAASQSGALARYFDLDRPIQVAWKNRKQFATCTEELKLYNERLVELCKKYGTQNPKNASAYDFDLGNPDVKPGEPGPQKKLFNAEFEKLEAMVLEDIPGDPVKVSETQGTLKVSDCELLDGSFLVD